MFDKKSEYALIKHDQDSIIYISVGGYIRLTCVDFSREKVFLKWKAWSDENCHEREKSGRNLNDNRVDLNECLEVVGTVQSAEDEFSQSSMKQINNGFTLNPYNRICNTENGNIISMKAKEFDLLYFLFSHKGRVFTKE